MTRYYNGKSGTSEDAESRASGAYIFRLNKGSKHTRDFFIRPDGAFSHPIGDVAAEIVRGTQCGEVQVGKKDILLIISS